MKDNQYEKQSWKVDLEIPRGMFPVKQGQFIAYSGSTGGSQGPHCHFEIRDTKTDKVLNELLFGLPIPDDVPPSIERLYMYDRNKSTYGQTPQYLPIKKTGNSYTTNENIIPVHSDKISFGITAYDKLSHSNNPNGIYEAIIYLDNFPLCAFQLDNISYDETRYVNANVDYKTRASSGPYIQHLSRLPGYPQGVYKDINSDGVIVLKDSDAHEVKIVVKDANGNTSVLQFKIKKGALDNNSIFNKSGKQSIDFQPNQVNVFETGNIQIYLPAPTLYDSLVFSHSEKSDNSSYSYSAVHSVLSGLIPSEDYFTITLKANKIIPEYLKDKMLIQQSWKGKNEVLKASRKEDWYSAKFNRFGDFELIADDVPPVIFIDFKDNANISKLRNIVVSPKDNKDVIKNFRAELDGKWLMFSNDKGKKYIYHFDEKCPRGKHELKISVEDEAGNKTQKIYHFTR